jgi:RNA polymerase sigma-54 factor
MKLSMTGQMRMEQKMKLAPRMIQSMEVLQLPLMALQEKIEAELNSNPVLERTEDVTEGSEITESANIETAETRELVVHEDTDRVEDFQRLDNFEKEYGEYGSQPYEPPYQRTSSGDSDRKLEALQNTAAQGQSLNDFLKEQWRLVEAEPNIKAAGEVIIDYLDEKGYLTVRLEQLHHPDKPELSLGCLQRAMELVQKLEPAGVGARDLRECLLIQMRQSPEDMSFELRMVEQCWTDLLENRLPQIARKLNCSMEPVNRAIERMSKLDTSPGLAVGRHENHPISADVILEYDEKDGYTIRLTDANLPSLRVNSFY